MLGAFIHGPAVHPTTAAARLPRAGIVHRLDKDTSGLLLVGKTLPACEALVRLIAEGEDRADNLRERVRQILGGMSPVRKEDLAVLEDIPECLICPLLEAVLAALQEPQGLPVQQAPQALTNVSQVLEVVVEALVVQVMAVLVVLAELVVEVVVEAVVLPLMLLVLVVLVVGAGSVLLLGKD